MPELSDEEWFEQYRERSAQQAGNVADFYVIAARCSLIDDTESPIERRLGQALAIRFYTPLSAQGCYLSWGGNITLEQAHAQFEDACPPPSHPTGTRFIGIFTQCRIASFRVDFLFIVKPL